MRRYAQIAAVVVLAAGVAAAFWQGGGISGGPPGGEQAAIPVEVAKAELGEIRQTVEAVGTTRANEAVTITAKTSGIVRSMSFEGGEKVEAGAVLVELDTRESEARLAEARAARENARRALDRGTALWKSRNIPQAKVEELQSALAGAEARVKIEEAKYSDLIIRAPFAGRLGIRKVSLGALVEPGDEVVTLDDTHLIKLDLDVPETVLIGLAPSQNITAIGAANPGRQFEGRVKVIDTRIDPQTRSVRIEAEFANADEALKPGMFLNATLEIARNSEAILIPEEAVLRTAQEAYVFIVREGRAVRSPVMLGARAPGKVAVQTGVAVGDEVVVGGLQFLRDGIAVRPVSGPGGAPEVSARTAPGQG